MMLHHRITLVAIWFAASTFGVATADEPVPPAKDEPVATDDASPQVPAPPDGAAEDPAEVADPETPVNVDDTKDKPSPKVYTPVDPAVVEEWITQLGDPSYDVREEARDRLVAAGPQVLPAVVRSAEGDNLEVAVRSIAIFGRLYERVSGPEVDMAEDALDGLLSSKNASASTRARTIAENSYELREQRALDRIVELGGVVEHVDEPVVVGGRIVVPRSDDGKGLGSVRLDPATWTGGDGGLKYVKRLTGLRRLYLVQGVVSEKAREDLQAALPALDIQGRGKAYLGIGGAPGIGGGCFVNVVRPGSAADKAGLQVGDRIESFGGKVVQGFPHLVELISEHAPGETVSAKILRNGINAVEVEITLGRWSDDKPAARTPGNVIPPVPVPLERTPDRE